VSEPRPDDFLDFHSLLSEDERQVQESVARFVDERVLPIIADAFDEHRFPVELVAEIGAMGLFGCSLVGYGCAGLDNVAYGLVCQELERGDSGVRSFVSVQGSLCMYPIHRYGTEEQKQRWLPPMARGETIGCFGLTESDGGSDPGSMKTQARKSGGDWILNGSKAWITNGTLADVAIVWARTTDGMRGFLVEKGMKGYTTRDILKKYSLRASVTSELFFEDVRVPDENRLPLAEGVSAALSCLTQARYGIAWGAIGAAIACFREVLGFCDTRITFGKPIASKQIVQRRLADMCRRITTAGLLVYHLGRLKDAGTMHHAQVSLAKWNNVRMALDVAREARDILGAGGISIEFQSIRHMLNLESVVTYEGTETIHQLIVGRSLTGHSAL
jgi:glutaryl-CoA dehydrogenase